MKTIREAGFFFLGFALSLACATATPYKYYGLNMPSACYVSAQLQGKTGAGGWPDLSGVECEPDEQVKGKCVIQLTSDFFAKDSALQTCQQQLSDCQAKNNGT